MLGVEAFTAIINPPETGILAVGGVQKRPVVRNDSEICIRDMLTMTLSVDHRAVDGALAATFIARLKQHLENPEALTA
jgi:pyruvate dehydrogenase E2 component (dihydrolipoamide acetyltransferase)